MVNVRYQMLNENTRFSKWYIDSFPTGVSIYFLFVISASVVKKTCISFYPISYCVSDKKQRRIHEKSFPF